MIKEINTNYKKWAGMTENKPIWQKINRSDRKLTEMTEIQENWQKFKRNEKKMTDNQQKLWEKKWNYRNSNEMTHKNYIIMNRNGWKLAETLTPNWTPASPFSQPEGACSWTFKIFINPSNIFFFLCNYVVSSKQTWFGLDLYQTPKLID